MTKYAMGFQARPEARLRRIEQSFGRTFRKMVESLEQILASLGDKPHCSTMNDIKLVMDRGLSNRPFGLHSIEPLDACHSSEIVTQLKMTPTATDHLRTLGVIFKHGLLVEPREKLCPRIILSTERMQKVKVTWHYLVERQDTGEHVVGQAQSSTRVLGI